MGIWALWDGVKSKVITSIYVNAVVISRNATTWIEDIQDSVCFDGASGKRSTFPSAVLRGRPL
ncbi:hypothetical protein BWQ96_08785 [Gracilariopsis chorda]|uniref:Uncharacterized protein n=1 Tax=Gracilariopsis chorda TaxID=448386 RepID=A0A2V3IHH0_9FLOR|nr:hypothetical protein BWQ96_08785 [Gracilariopsis chorda]|eukprot:PXF41478.1 hypothetical protein BWQ96_08785 [Gracilariopsis chorda]